MRTLTLIYDDTCPCCIRAAAWLSQQRPRSALRLLPSSAAQRDPRWGVLTEPLRAGAWVAVDAAGAYYLGVRAQLIALYALERYSALAELAATPRFRPAAGRIFAAVTSGRCRIPRRRAALYAAACRAAKVGAAQTCAADRWVTDAAPYRQSA